MFKLKSKPKAGIIINPAKLDIDDAVSFWANGAYTIPVDENAPVHDYRALIKHCKEKGIDPSELSCEEITRFEIKKTPAQV